MTSVLSSKFYEGENICLVRLIFSRIEILMDSKKWLIVIIANVMIFSGCNLSSNIAENKENNIFKTLESVYIQTPMYEQGDWWQPDVNITWQWNLSGEVDTSIEVDMYDLDLEETNKSTIDYLHNQNRIVICYIIHVTKQPRINCTARIYGAYISSLFGVIR